MTTTRKAPARAIIRDLECRFAAGDQGAFEGYASIWGQPDAYGDVIKRGAFLKSLAEHARAKTRPPLLWSHDPSMPVGTWSSITEDERGLKVTGQLVTATQRGSEAYELLKAGAITGLSIGFRARGSERGPNGARVLTNIDLVEISLVSLPAAGRARVTAVRSVSGHGSSAAAFVQACRSAATMLRKGL